MLQEKRRVPPALPIGHLSRQLQLPGAGGAAGGGGHRGAQPPAAPRDLLRRSWAGDGSCRGRCGARAPVKYYIFIY